MPRFQELAEKYGFIPVWLTTYEMANDNFFVDYFKNKQKEKLCEIGAHIHAWNNPPEYELTRVTSERDFLVEYPIDIMDKKVASLTCILTEKFEEKPVSHRAGRWVMNDDYFDVLKKNGYMVDCSVTPHINWHKTIGATGKRGTDYSKCPEYPYFFKGVLEVPVTILKMHYFDIKRINSLGDIVKEMYRFITGRAEWIRPNATFNISRMKKVMDVFKKKSQYIMFMIHSSELMPNGSPSFKNEQDIEKLYEVIQELFEYAYKEGYRGISLRDFGVKNGVNQI